MRCRASEESATFPARYRPLVRRSWELRAGLPHPATQRIDGFEPDRRQDLTVRQTPFERAVFTLAR